MLRVVVAVALATAILAVSLPAIDAAGRDRTSATVTDEVDALETAVRDLQHSDGAVPQGTSGARRVVTVRLPDRGWASARLAYLAVGGRPGASCVDRTETALAWQVVDGPVQTRRLPGVQLEHADGDGDDDPLVLREPGKHRLVLTLVERAGDRTVRVQRLDGPDEPS
jgi:hypothetical protein